MRGWRGSGARRTGLAGAAQAGIGKDDVDAAKPAAGGGTGGLIFANAGVAEFRPLEAVDDDHFDRPFAINARGVLRTVPKAAPVLHDEASVIPTTSGAKVIGMPAPSVCAGTKAAVRALARRLSAAASGSMPSRPV